MHAKQKGTPNRRASNPAQHIGQEGVGKCEADTGTNTNTKTLMHAHMQIFDPCTRVNHQRSRRRSPVRYAPNAAPSQNLAKRVAAVAAVLGSTNAEELETQN